MGQFVDQQALTDHALAREIVAIGLAAGMKMYMPAWGHRGLARLEECPFTAFQRDAVIVDRRAEDRSRDAPLAGGQRALAADRAGGRRFGFEIDRMRQRRLRAP
ncbi:hypothetical protein GCM10022600_17840 [Qipengyuania pelagi]